MRARPHTSRGSAPWPRLPVAVVAICAIGLFPVLSLGCEGDPPINPFTGTSGAGGGAGQGGSGGGGVDSELGGPCVEDAQCNDELDCTSDRCDQDFARCRFTRDNSVCENGVYCDGVELCDLKQGCVAGTPPSCSDGSVCTIDTCIEASQTCVHVPRDADQDGDPDAHCGGGDCDDTNPAVNSSAAEVCGNGRDDNCNGQKDEAGCVNPQHDTCQTALVVDRAGSYVLQTSGAALNYATSCSPPSATGDVVVAVMVPAGPPQDVLIRARNPLAPISVAMAGQCGVAASEIACGASFIHPQGGLVAKLRARSVGGGASATPLPVYITTAATGNVTLDVSFAPASSAPAEETCGSAVTIATDAPQTIEIIDAIADLASNCSPQTGELVYRFTLSEPRDVDLYAISLDNDGVPVLSLRDEDCALLEDEVACHSALSTHIYRHALPAGDHYVAVAGSAPTRVSLNILTSPPSVAPNDEDCNSSASLVPNVTQPISFDDHQDDVSLGCFGQATDVAYNLNLAEPSDVLVVMRSSAQDSASVQIASEGCGTSSLISCGFGAKSPIRTRKRNLQGGDYDIVAESLFGLPGQLTAFVRPYAPQTIVPFADNCSDALTISPNGGFYAGNTSNQTADFSAGCDQGGGPPNGAKDQLLKLELVAQKRVIFDMLGSGYDALLDVRKGPACPGTEVPLGCTISNSSSKSYLDLILDAGTYFVQIDGLGTATGPWVLDVHVVDP